jgi:hypothetical protein
LQQALAITQVDEDDATMIAAPVYPPGDRDRPADLGAIDLAAVMTAHRSGPFEPNPLKAKAALASRGRGCYEEGYG